MADRGAPSQPPTSASRSRRHGLGWLFIALAGGGIVGLVLLTTRASPDDETPTIADGGLVGGATLTAIVERPEAFVDDEVTVRGQVYGVFGPRTFTIGGEPAESGGELLVVSIGEIPGEGGQPAEAISDSVAAEVTGEIRIFDENLVEEVAAPDLADALPQWQGRPIVVARSITLIAGPGEGTTAAGGRGPTVEPDTLIRQFDRFRGETVTVEGPVIQVLGANGFVLGESEVLIVAKQATVPDTLRIGERVRVTGTPQRFDVGRYEERLGLDLDWDSYRQYAGRRAIIAATVQAVR